MENDLQNIVPEELKAHRQWVCWRREIRNGKETKIPYQTSEIEAKVNSSDTWTSFLKATSAASMSSKKFDGVGFVLKPNGGFIGVDLDKCRDETGTLTEKAQQILCLFPDTYAEISPSNTGIRLFLKGTLPEGSRNRKGHFEIYDQDRYLTVTGNMLPDRPRTIAEAGDRLTPLLEVLFPAEVETSRPIPPPRVVPSTDLDEDDILQKAFAAQNGAEIEALWNGDTAAYGGDHSAADLSLCSHLAFYCGPDGMDRVDALFRRSGLMREKWDKKHRSDGTTYGEMTLEKAYRGKTEFYEQSDFVALSTPVNGKKPARVQSASSSASAFSNLVLWPNPIDAAAYHGPMGQIVKTLAPETEADPVAILVQLLIMYGNLIGRSAYYYIGGAKHYTNLFGVIVGKSGTSGKGTSQAVARSVLERAEQRVPALKDEKTGEVFRWLPDRVKAGLSSGEGLIFHVRNRQTKLQDKKDPKTGEVTGQEEVETDPGVKDKRLLSVETEFTSVLDVSSRDSNTLSAQIRNAWDTGSLYNLTKNSTLEATGAHISLIGHITMAELKRKLSETEQANGFANRFLWICAKRSNILPFGGQYSEATLSNLADLLTLPIMFGREMSSMDMSEQAQELWRDLYPQLTAERPGLYGVMTSRAAPITLRLSMLYALLDCKPYIATEHLKAAVSVWQYAEESVTCLFGDSIGDAVADTILRALRQAQGGLTRTEVNDLLGRNYKADRISLALEALSECGLAEPCREEPKEGKGRPTERWMATLLKGERG